MYFKFSVLSLLLLSALAACSTQETGTDEVSSDGTMRASFVSSEAGNNEAGEVELSSEAGKREPFMYHFNYNGASLNLLESSDSAVSGGTFEVQGGAQILASTWLPYEIDYAGQAVTREVHGGNEVYRYSLAADSAAADASCGSDFAIVPFANQVLKLELKFCGEDQRNAGLEALSDLTGDLTLESL